MPDNFKSDYEVGYTDAPADYADGRTLVALGEARVGGPDNRYWRGYCDGVAQARQADFKQQMEYVNAREWDSHIKGFHGVGDGSGRALPHQPTYGTPAHPGTPPEPREWRSDYRLAFVLSIVLIVLLILTRDWAL